MKIFVLFLAIIGSAFGFKARAQHPIDTNVYSLVEVMPQFPGGTEALSSYFSKAIRYPKSALRDSVEGRVYVKFIIGQTGGIGKVWIARGLRKDLDKEAMRVIRKMPKWIPGRRKGVPVNVKYTYPVYFNLPKR